MSMSQAEYKHKNRLIRLNLDENMEPEHKALLIEHADEIALKIRHRYQSHRIGSAMGFEILYELGRLMKKDEF